MLSRLGRYSIIAGFLLLLFGIYPTTKMFHIKDNFTSATGTEEGLLNLDKGNSISDDIGEATKVRVTENYGKLPLSFIQNDGQIDEKVMFYERGSGHSTFFTKEGVYLQLTSSQKPNDKEHIHIPDTETNPSIPGQGQTNLSLPPESKYDIIKLVPFGANKNPKIIAEGVQSGKANYFIGNDPEKWKTNIPTYEAVIYKDVYKGIDMKFYGNNRQMEYDIVVKPGAALSQVQLSYEGIEGLSITGDGKMEIALKEDKVIQNKPYCYQEIEGKRVEVAGKFKILSSELSNPKSPDQTAGRIATGQAETKNPQYAYAFEVASYNKSHTLIIDPLLVYSTYLGGSSTDRGWGIGIAVDTSGNAYVTGETPSTDFPTVSAFDSTHNGATDVFVTMLDASGTSLTYSTYLGGSSNDFGRSIAVDTSGNAYLTGHTLSTDFPTASAFDSSYNGGGDDGFVTKLNATGTSLTFSTYLGGSSQDEGNAITVDTSGNVYITGFTSSTDFPTASAYDGSLNGTRDAFVTKLDASGTSLTYSTYLGGGSEDRVNAISVDTSGNAYVTGFTSSTDFPTASAFDSSHNGADDAFVTMLDASGTSLVYSTYLGGSGTDFGFGIAVDTSGNAYVTGFTGSTNFPTASAYDGSLNGAGDAFATKLDASGTSLVYSTYLGGSGTDYSLGIAVDNSGNTYVTGFTSSTDFPTASAYDDNYNGADDAFVTMLDASGTSLIYSTYLGGSDYEWGQGIAVDNSGNAYVTGRTHSTDFPTASAFDSSHNGNDDAFVTKFSPAPVIIVSPTAYDFGTLDVGDSSIPQTFTISNTGDADLIIGTIGLTGVDASEFDIQNDVFCSAQIIAPSDTCTIDVIFSPTSEGANSANLSIPSNDPDTPVLSVQLSGTGIDPNAVDDDGDGYTEYEGDCNDGDDTIYPDACDIKGDGIDQDCDGVDRTKGKPCPDIGSGNQEICDDEIDNDGDGKVDCADKKDCGKDPACGGTQEICDDGIDNDGDGKVDCADKKDCGKDPACP